MGLIMLKKSKLFFSFILVLLLTTSNNLMPSGFFKSWMSYYMFGNMSEQNLSPKEFEKKVTSYTIPFIVGVCKSLDDEKLEGNILRSSGRIAKFASMFVKDFGIYAQQDFAEGSEASKGLESISNCLNRTISPLIIKSSIIFVVTAAGYFTVKYGIPVVAKMIERALMRPKLIIASSQKSYWELLFGKPKVKEVPMIFSPNLENRLNDIIKVTSMIHKKIKEGKTNVLYRNLMLYGPPGTGKTLFATELAKRCGLEYVFMSGSSFSKFKDGEGIEALDELFVWANKSNGLLIFIDEAETFLLSRDKMDPQSKAYLLLNNFLNYTGTRSNRFMFVFATNHKDALDSAMYRRIDDLVEMPLPEKTERIRILNLYKNTILMDTKQNGAEFAQSVEKILTPELIEAIADRTKGLSGSELEGIINNIKTSADILTPSVVTKKLVDTVVQQAIDKYKAFTGSHIHSVIEG